MRRRVSLIALTLLALAWWAMRPAEPPQAAGPTPADSLAARHARSAPRPAPQPVPDDAEDEPTPHDHVDNASIVVHLREASIGFLVFPRRAHLDPAVFWPLEGEAPFPAGQAAPALQDLLDDQAEPGSPAETEWLALALEEGHDPDTVPTDDPWAAVLALEVARRSARHDQLEDFRAARDRGEGPENGFITPEALVGPPDVGLQLGLAEDIVAAWPDHPAAEYARLYQLDAVVRGETDRNGRRLAVDQLRHTDDALVAAQAVGLLTRLPKEALEPSDLDRLESFVADFADLVDPLETAAFGLDQALALDDPARVRRWLAHYEEAIASSCTETDPELVSGDCLTHLDNRNEAVAYAGDRDVGDARTWREAFEIAGYACARDGEDWSVAPIRTVAHWRENWSWDPWDRGDSSFARCFADRASQGPDPPFDALDVRVAVVR